MPDFRPRLALLKLIVQDKRRSLRAGSLFTKSLTQQVSPVLIISFSTFEVSSFS